MNTLATEIPMETHEAEATVRRVYLPNDETTITSCAESLMSIIAPKKKLFSRGISIVHVENDDEGRQEIREVNAVGFRSLAESHCELWVKSVDAKGKLRESPRRMSKENADAIMGCHSALRILPRIKSLCSFPPLRRDGSIPEEGFDSATGILVSSDIVVEQMKAPDGAALLNNLLRDWKFVSPADQSRAISMLLAPMLRLGPWVSERVNFPIFTIEADLSQTGKGMLMKTIAAIYNESPAMVTQPQGGVGSFDESLSSALMKGRPIIQLDNLRGRLNSMNLEGFVTATGLFHARALRREMEIDSRKFVIYATSNGIESTPDAANRMCVTRLRKQEDGYQWHPWEEGSLFEHIETNRGKYLGAICAVLREWIQSGEPRVTCNHDFREWSGASNWIVQNVFQLPPLMDGHDEVKERVSSPGLGFLREIALALRGKEATMSASELAERAENEGIPIPGWDAGKDDEVALRKHIGTILSKCFNGNNIINIEGVFIHKEEHSSPRPDGKGYWQAKVYTFRREPNQEQSCFPH